MSKTSSHIAIIVPWSINHDSRAQRTLKVLEVFGQVDVFYIPNNEEDIVRWDSSADTKFIALSLPETSFLNKIYTNTFFYKVYDYFLEEIYNQNKRYNVVYMHDLLSGNIGLELKRKYNCKLIYDVHDLYLETLNQQFPVSPSGKPKLKYQPIIFLMKIIGARFEKKVLKESNLVFTVNQSCQEYLIETYNYPEVKFFHNYPEYRDAPARNSKISETLFLAESKNTCIYIGNLSRGRHLEEIIQSSKYLDNENILVVVGNGHLKQDLINISKKDKTYNRKVYFIDSIPYNNLFNSISEAKLGIMLLDPINKSKEYAFANKITEYMLCSIPPLLSNHKEHQKLMKYSEVGFIIDNYSPENIGKTINKIMRDKVVLAQKSELARKAFELKYNWNKEKESLITEISKILQ